MLEFASAVLLEHGHRKLFDGVVIANPLDDADVVLAVSSRPATGGFVVTHIAFWNYIRKPTLVDDHVQNCHHLVPNERGQPDVAVVILLVQTKLLEFKVVVVGGTVKAPQLIESWEDSGKEQLCGLKITI